ncbi:MULTISPECIES: efflux RND transporter permease subunit [unclassified Colwellia]|nr:MMPL family transporter [Colwellia sp. MB02u-7]MBA6237717.1 MMPL family transporter [Colwellia sp. MB02u-11]MBA6257820.1 MMPL family transporter [Colwellia sp. MB3u-28]MBA6260877.1 MMPL family transporter [Colwellia sp. MB3u-41]MBA6300855.1 MMPL family transporter [Colwellia sp. MB3u-22]MBA6310778.1 MMPL family transporter [Colwellia sp. MB3u-64]
MVAISLAMMPNLKIDTDPENMLSRDAPARIFHNQTKADFQMRDMIVVGIVSKNNIFTPNSLQVVEQLSTKVLQIEGVIAQDLLSLSVVDNITQEKDSQGKNSGIRFEYLMKQAPSSLEGSLEIQQAVKRLPMLNNTLVSGDNKAIAIYVPIQAKDMSYNIAEQIRTISKSFPAELVANVDFHITGLPVAEDQFGYEMFVQMGVAAPLAGLAIFVLLWYFFRNFPLIIAPMVVAMATVIIVMGSLIGMGFTVHIMSSMIAIFLMPIAVVDSVHILSEFAEKYKTGDDAGDVVKGVMKHLYTPMLYTSITSAIGFYSLMLTPIPPVKVFGAFIGTGILLAFALTIIYIPAYISRLKPKTLAKLHDAILRTEQKGRLANALESLGRFATQKTKLILMGFVALFLISIEGVSRIEINDNPVNWFKADHEIRIADKVLNAHFAGTYDAWLVFRNNNRENSAAVSNFKKVLATLDINLTSAKQINAFIADVKSTGQDSFINQNLLVLLDDLAFSANDEEQLILEQLVNITDTAFNENKVFLDPDLLKWQSDFQQALLTTGLVGKSNGLADIVKTVNRELFSGEDKDFALPESSNGVAQTLLQYQSSHRPQDLWHFVTKDYQQSLLWLQMISGDNQHTTKVVNWTEAYITKHPMPKDISYQWAGKSYLNIVWQDAMVNGMIDSLLSSFVIVFLMMVVLFRSLKYGILAMLPLTLTISMIYGLIGWIGKDYDMPIAVLSALTLGLSIDFAIHFLQRARELEKELGSLALALSAMFQEPSRAISRNAIVIAIGFTPLLLSPLIPYITVGFFLASIMALSALVTLMLLPALMTLFAGKHPLKNKHS